MTYAPNEDELRAAYEEQERLRAEAERLKAEVGATQEMADVIQEAANDSIAEWTRQRVEWEAERDALRARVAELEVLVGEFRSNARTDAASATRIVDERDALRARVAELSELLLGRNAALGEARARVAELEEQVATATRQREARSREVRQERERAEKAEAQVATLRALARLVIEQTGEDENGDMPDHPRGALLTLRKAALAATEPRGGTT